MIIYYLDCIQLRELMNSIDFSGHVYRYSYLLELSLVSGSALLLVGPTGTGKSLCIREKMNLFNEEEMATFSLAFTAQTSSAQVQVSPLSLSTPCPALPTSL